MSDNEINEDQEVKYIDSSFEPDHPDALPDNNSRVIIERDGDILILTKISACLICIMIILFCVSRIG